MSRPDRSRSAVSPLKPIALIIALALAGAIFALAIAPDAQRVAAMPTGPTPTATLTATFTATLTQSPSPTGTSTATFTPTPMTQCTPGNLDSTFNHFGYLTTSISVSATGRSAALQPDGKIVVAGSSYDGMHSHLTLARYNTDGTLDTSFNGTGTLIMPDSTNLDGASAVGVQSDGKIVAVGSGWAIVRLNSDGSFDTTWGGTGIVRTILTPHYATAYALALPSDGRVVVAGYYYDGSAGQFMAARYTSDGALDTTFNGVGYATTPVYGAGIHGVAVQPDGKIVIAGQSDSIFTVVRFTAAGALDTSFGGSGIVMTIVGPSFDVARAVAVQADGKIVVAGESFRGDVTLYDFAVVRYSPDGTLDTSFNGTGIAITGVGQFNNQAYSVALQPDGKIVVGGEDDSWLGYTKSFGVVRFMPNGLLDSSFGSNGKVSTLIEREDELDSVMVQSDGKIVAAGNSYGWDGQDYNYHFAVARYFGNRCAADTPTNTATASPTPTFSATSTATAAGTPTLGNYADVSITVSGNTAVTPDAAPLDAAAINVSTSTNFKGELYANPVTGAVRIVNAHPAGTYTVAVKAFSNSGLSSSKTFVLTVTTPTTCAQVNFDEPRLFGAGQSPYDVAIADFNGDTRQDIVVVNQLSSNVTVLLGSANGTFSQTGTAPVGGQIPFSVATGDFNNDGKADVIVSNDQSASVSVLLGDGTGHFGPATNMFVPWRYPGSLAVGDYNGDGKQDFAMDAGQGISIYSGNGAGGFALAGSFPAGNSPESLALGDFNEDGNQDLAATDEYAHTVAILLGDGAGHLGTAVSFPTNNYASGIATGDFNGDSHQDLAVISYDDSNVNILLGNGLGSFASAGTFGGLFQPEGVKVGDFDGDGKQDLAVADTFGQAAIMLGDGTGNFGAPSVFKTYGGSEGIVVGDFNSDGKQDLAFGDFGSDRIDVLLRNCVPLPTPTNTFTPPLTPLVTPSEGPTPTSTATFTPTHMGTFSPTATVTPTGTPPYPFCGGFPVGPLIENFDGLTAPALPAAWTATNAVDPDGILWQTSNSGLPSPPADSAPNAAWINAPSAVSDKYLDSPEFNPFEVSWVQLRFQNNFNLQSGRDGALLEISTNNGPFRDILTAGGTFEAGGYNSTISPGTGSPIAGRQAWSGSSGGFITTIVNIPWGFPTKLRWRMATDNSVASDGWRIDSVQVIACHTMGTSSPSPTNTATPTQTQTPFPELDLTVSQSAPPATFGMPSYVPYTVRVTNSPAALGGTACPTVRFGYPTGMPFTFVSTSGTNGYMGTPDAEGVTFTGGCLSSSGGVHASATLTVLLMTNSLGTLTSPGSNVVVDPENAIPENDESNNTAQTIYTSIFYKTQTPTPTFTATPTTTATPTATPSPTCYVNVFNRAPIAINDNAPGSPYPSTITVSNVAGTITFVSATLTGLTHTFPDDIDIMLVGPDGQNTLLMSDAGDNLGVTNVDLLIHPTYGALLPDRSQIYSGIYRPTNYDMVTDVFPAPAPSPGATVGLSVFNGTNPNGTWSLYVRDDFGGDLGSISHGWSLEMLTNGCATTPTPTATATHTPTPVESATPTATPTRTQTPFPEYDLTISQSAAPDPVFAGQQTLTYTLIVTNSPSALGGNACPNVRFGFPQGFGVHFNYTGSSGTNGYTGHADAGGVTFSGGCISSLGGVTGTATLHVDIFPDALSSGTLFSFGNNVVVDPENLWNESNENNNTAETIQTSVINKTTPTPTPAAVRADFDGDHKTDLSVFRPSEGNWYVDRSSAGLLGIHFGLNGDVPVPGDYDGDRKIDIAVFRGDSTGQSPDFFILNSSDNTVSYAYWGLQSDTPLIGDYDGDGKTDVCVYRPSNNTFYILVTSNDTAWNLNFGTAGDIPFMMDYDGDGKSNIAVFRPSDGTWYIGKPGADPAHHFYAVPFGLAGDLPVPADYDGDNKDDIAVFRPSDGNWYIIRSSDQQFVATHWGLNGDIPVPADYDGDGRDDIAVYRNGIWYINRSTAGFAGYYYGLPTDIPIPKRYIP